MAHTTRTPLAPILLSCLILTLGLPGLSLAQSTQGNLEDLEFEILNATTGEAGTIERLEIQYTTERLNPVLDIQPEGSSFTVPDVPIKDVGRYVITAWKDGVPYFWSIRGRQIIDGPITLHVFDTINDLESVRITGLNVLLRKGESVVDLEYMVKADNPVRPQVTVVGRTTLEILVPEGATGFKASYTRGPEPIDIPVTSLGRTRVGLEVPLTTGQNQIRLVCSILWREGLKIPVGANVPVDAWSLLATPENLDIQAQELEPDNSQDLPGYLRFQGPALEAGRNFDITIKGSIPAGPKEDVFATEAPAETEADQDGAAEEKGGNSFPLIIGLPIIVVLIILIARRRRS